MHNSRRGFLVIPVLLLSAALVAASPKGILSVGPEGTDTSFILDSRGAVETFQGAMPNEELLARHEILKAGFDERSRIAAQAETEGQESLVNPGSEYQVAYEVHAPSTGDGKSYLENRYEDGTVTGQYSVMNPDGSHRVVTYTATPEGGYKAIVSKKEADDVITSSIPIAEPVVNPNRLGYYDDSDEQIIGRNFNNGLENYESDTEFGYNIETSGFFGGFRSGVSRPGYYGGDKTGFYKPSDIFDEEKIIRNDGQFGVKMEHNNQNQISAHIHENIQNQPQLSAHVQDSTDQQISQENTKELEHTAKITNTVLKRPVYHLIPVSVQRFSLKDMLEKYNIENNYKWLERRKVPFTVLPAYIKRFS